MACTDTAGEVVFVGDDVVPDAVDGIDVGLFAGERGDIGHAGIHITGAHGVSYGLVLLHDGLMALAVEVVAGCLAPVVEEVLGEVEILLLAGEDIEAGKRHLGNLVAGHDVGLSLAAAYLTEAALGITLGDVEELAAARGLEVGTGGIDHVAEVVELVAEDFFLLPAFLTGPLVRLLGVDGARGVEVAVRLLGGSHDIEHGVDVGLEFAVRIGLQDVGGTLDGLIDIGVVEREAHE